MKKRLFLSILASSAFFSAKAQVATTVSVGAGYANQVWHGLQNGDQGTAPKNNWDIAFEISGQTSAILTNSANGIELWKHPTADTANWATLDTTGLHTWNKFYNSDTTWAVGAFNKAAVPTNQFDLGWGLYNMVNHQIMGNRLFVIKLSNGDFQKIWIKKLASGTYVFRHAKLNNTGDVTRTLAKTAYPGKNFGYYSLQTQTATDREPATANWDLTFTQYTTFLPAAYTVTGVLANKGVTVARAQPIATPATYTNYQAHTFSGRINTIGYNWKSLNQTTMAYDVKNDLVFFVKDKANAIWKVVFTGFGGSANGNNTFTKEKLAGPNGVMENAAAGNFAVYPNPVSGNGNLNLALDLPAGVTQADLLISDLNGRVVKTEKLNNLTGFSAKELPLNNLNAGIYTLQIIHAKGRLVQKLAIN